jgi:hypothetical protein
MIACKENEVAKSSNPKFENQSFEENVLYTRDNLKTLARSLTNLRKDKDFRDLLYMEIERKFDGEHNVLFQSLANLQEKSGRNYGALMSSVFSSSDAFNKSLNAFNNIEGQDYYPQIYIPFYDDLVDKKGAGLRVLTEENEPVIVLFTGDDTKDEFPGYKFNENGELVEAGFMVNENFAMANEVWVISINERYFGEETGNSNGNGNRSTASPSAIVDLIKCKCHFESWAAGASEVNIITVFSDWGFYSGSVNTYGKGPNEGGEIYKFSREDVKKQRLKDVNFYILNDWNDREPNRPYGNYVIFEYDAIPTGRKDAFWYHGGAVYTYKYRSADVAYDAQSVYKGDFSFHSVNKPCLEWQASYY